MWNTAEAAHGRDDGGSIRSGRSVSQVSGACLWAGLMWAGCVLFFLPGVAHHVFCRALEWFYLRMGCQSLDDPSVKGLYQLLARIGDGWMKMQIVRMEFSQLV